jgi:hypothetical protein
MLKFTKKSIMDLTWLAIVGVGVRVGWWGECTWRWRRLARGKPLVRRKTWREVKALREVKTLGGEGLDGGEDLGLELKTLAGAEDTRWRHLAMWDSWQVVTLKEKKHLARGEHLVRWKHLVRYLAEAEGVEVVKSWMQLKFAWGLGASSQCDRLVSVTYWNSSLTHWLVSMTHWQVSMTLRIRLLRMRTRNSASLTELVMGKSLNFGISSYLNQNPSFAHTHAHVRFSISHWTSDG